ncbi:hypothetical protein JNM87_05875 [Candidatus Saccharibacteria bacterium]|nr:hypothetical protein [Candidatus Saccharibacteria bacterium]
MTFIVAERLLGVHRRERWLLVLAGILFFISYYLPSPLIEGKDTAFTTHMVGGGVFSGLVWLYACRVKGISGRAWWWELGTLYVLVCSLGVANELFEVILYLAGHMPHGISDTSWDLVANTFGALCFYAGYKLSRVNWRA